MSTIETEADAKDDQARARSQARAQLESILDMTQRLSHAQECDGGEECEATDEEIYAGINLRYEGGDKASDDERAQYHDAEEARQRIHEDPLSVEVRSGWYTPGSEDNKPEEYVILLSTGGPATQIIGELDRYGQPESARIEHQDWFTPWKELRDVSEEEREALLVYAQQFWFGD